MNDKQIMTLPKSSMYDCVGTVPKVDMSVMEGYKFSDSVASDRVPVYVYVLVQDMWDHSRTIKHIGGGAVGQLLPVRPGTEHNPRTGSELCDQTVDSYLDDINIKTTCVDAGSEPVVYHDGKAVIVYRYMCNANAARPHDDVYWCVMPEVDDTDKSLSSKVVNYVLGHVDSRMVANIWETPTKEILQSKYRSDYVSSTCGYWYVDGGTDCIRTGGDGLVNHCLYNTHSIREIRDHFMRWRAGEFVPLKDLSLDHIHNIIKDNHPAEQNLDLYEREILFRTHFNIPNE